MKYLIILISIILDGLIPNITLFSFNNITYFTPVCTSISLIFLYSEDKKFYKILFFISMIYGSLYINNLILSITVFFLEVVFIKLFKKIFSDNFFTIVIQILFTIIIWDLLFFLFNSILITNSFVWNNYFYKVTHSILFNLAYGIFLFLILKKRSKILVK